MSANDPKQTWAHNTSQLGRSSDFIWLFGSAVAVEKSRLIPSYRDYQFARSSFSILLIFVVYFPIKFTRWENPMRHLGWLFAIAAAVVVIHIGKSMNGATPSVGLLSTDGMHISMMQRRADLNMSVTVIDNPF